MKTEDMKRGIPPVFHDEVWKTELHYGGGTLEKSITLQTNSRNKLKCQLLALRNEIDRSLEALGN